MPTRYPDWLNMVHNMTRLAQIINKCKFKQSWWRDEDSVNFGDLTYYIYCPSNRPKCLYIVVMVTGSYRLKCLYVVVMVTELLQTQVFVCRSHSDGVARTHLLHEVGVEGDEEAVGLQGADTLFVRLVYDVSTLGKYHVTLHTLFPLDYCNTWH